MIVPSDAIGRVRRRLVPGSHPIRVRITIRNPRRAENGRSSGLDAHGSVPGSCYRFVTAFDTDNLARGNGPPA